MPATSAAAFFSPGETMTTSSKFRYSVKSYERSLAFLTRPGAKSTYMLYEGDPGMASSLATRRNKVSINPQNNTEELLNMQEGFSEMCSVCANLDPWSNRGALEFAHQIIATTPQYWRKATPSGIYRAFSEEGCLYCSLIFDGLSVFSRENYGTVNAWMEEEEVKIMIRGNEPEKEFGPTLTVRLSKTDKVRFYTPRGGWKLPSIPAIGEGNTVAKTTGEALKAVKDVLWTCIKHHTPCHGGKPTTLPSRVIDVGNSQDDIRVFEPKGAEGIYFTLSYCWGNKGEEAKTTRANIRRRLQKLPHNELSKTHQDAVYITRQMGVRYLWIDAICILQDDSTDWATESAKMGSIYHNSMLTLAAAESVDAEGGILLDRPSLVSDARGIGMTVTEQPSGIQTKIAALCCGSVVKHKKWSNCVSSQPHKVVPQDLEGLSLESRAWCFQERLLSNRIVHFTRDEFFWECQTVKYCECGEILYNSGHGPGVSTIRDDFQDMIATKDNKARIKSWMWIVSESSRRKITFQKHRLPCLSGIAKHLQNEGFGEYYAGFWKVGLLEQLLWTVEDFSSARRAKRPSAPSWSYASIEHSMFTFQFEDMEISAKEYLTTIEEVNCTPLTTDPTGAVAGGLLRLSGPMLSMRLCFIPSLINQPKWVVGLSRQMALQLKRSQSDQAIGSFKADFLVGYKREGLDDDQVNETESTTTTTQQETTVRLLAICKSQQQLWNGQVNKLICLVLRENTGERNKWERIGVVVLDENDDWVSILEEMRIISIDIV